MNHKTDRSAAIAVITREEKFLVIQRSKKVRAPGKFCFPGGEVEAGEHFAEAVVREIREELGITVKPLRPLWQSVAPSGCVLNWIQVSYDDSCESIDINTKEVESFHWMSSQELADHPDVLPTNVEFLKALANGEFQVF